MRAFLLARRQADVMMVLLLTAAAMGACGGDRDEPGGYGLQGGAGGTTGTTSTSGTGATGTGGGGLGSSGAAELSDGLIHAYKFDQADSLVDHIGNADATTVSVSTFGMSGNVDDAWEFSTATSDYVALVPGMLDGLPAITVCVWFQCYGANQAGLFTFQPDGALTQDFLEIGWKLGSSLQAGDITPLTWHLACGQMGDTSNQGLKLFVDAVELGDDPGASSVDNSGPNPQVVLGANAAVFQDQLTDHFDGLIDEVYIWNRGLTEAQHAELYALGGAQFW